MSFNDEGTRSSKQIQGTGLDGSTRNFRIDDDGNLLVNVSTNSVSVPNTSGEFNDEGTRSSKQVQGTGLDGSVKNFIIDDNGYLKIVIGNKQELINEFVAAVDTIDLKVVETLPTQDISTSTIYLVPRSTSQTNNSYDEYIYSNNSWEKIGSTDVDLSQYQPLLVSGTNIKTINNESILGSGNINVGGGGSVENSYSESTTNAYSCDYINDNFLPSEVNLGTVLFSGNEYISSSGTTINLSDNISNYDYFMIEIKCTSSNYTFPPCIVTKNFFAQDNNRILPFHYINSNSVQMGDFSLPYESYTGKSFKIKFDRGFDGNNVTKVTGFKNKIPSVVQREGEVYSTSETVVGTWINGKPVYRKVLEFSNFTYSGNVPSNKVISTGYTFAQIKPISINGFAFGNDFALPITSTEGTWANSNLRVYLDGNGNIQLYESKKENELASTTLNGYVILEYTKTTD